MAKYGKVKEYRSESGEVIPAGRDGAPAWRFTDNDILTPIYSTPKALPTPRRESERVDGPIANLASGVAGCTAKLVAIASVIGFIVIGVVLAVVSSMPYRMKIKMWNTIQAGLIVVVGLVVLVIVLSIVSWLKQKQQEREEHMAEMFERAADVAIKNAGARLTVSQAAVNEAEADRIKRETQQTVIVADWNQQVYMLEEKQGQTYTRLDATPTRRINGVDVQVTEEEFRIWQMRQLMMRPNATQALPQELPGSEPGLLDLTRDLERLLVVGGSGAGKTMLLQWQLDQLLALNDGLKLIVVDPHDNRKTWTDRAQIVGGGQDYREARQAIMAYASEVKFRYEQRYSEALDSADFEPMALVIDELFEIMMETGDKELLARYRKTLTGGRKINAFLIVSGQSERVEAIGLKNYGDIIKSFNGVVNLDGTWKSGGVTATLDMHDSRGKMPVRLPPEYSKDRAVREIGQGPQYLQLDAPEITDAVWADVDPLTDEILALWDSGETRLTYITRELGLGVGGDQTSQVKEVLRLHGRIS